MIALSLPEIGPEEEAGVLAVLRSGWLAMGAQTERLEHEWAALCGARHAIFMANGTLALEAVLRCSGVGAGDEVVVPAFGFNAAASATLMVGATPVFVDVSADDFCVATNVISAAVTPRTRAVMPVHLFGLMADMEPISALAKRHSLLVVEDAAQAVGASYRGRAPGSFGPAVFSLYATKNVAAGEGGMVVTDDALLAERLRRYRNHGTRDRYEHDSLGTNLRPTDIAAAIALAQLARLADSARRREANAARLSEALGGLNVPRVPAGRRHAWHQFTVRFEHGRDEIARRLTRRGVGWGIYYPRPANRQRYIRERLPAAYAHRFPTAERLSGEVLSLPVRPNLSADELATVIDAMLEAVSLLTTREFGA